MNSKIKNSTKFIIKFVTYLILGSIFATGFLFIYCPFKALKWAFNEEASNV